MDGSMKNSTKIVLVIAVIALIAGVWGLRRWQDMQAGLGSAASSETAGGEAASALYTDTINLDEFKAEGLPILINFSGGG